MCSARVDQVFAAREVYRSITADEAGVPPHTSRCPTPRPGLVELWPLIAPAERREIEGWDAPFDTESEISPRVLLARRIADARQAVDGARRRSPATCWCWCASAGRCSRRSSAR